ncbi:MULTISPECIES: acetolactate synthase small subunit [unclassified Staphylococcus]|uniref:acetolactate synthase small subunit n=1 Tax=unclassified Staphylococcus TaxID=91994 RepID=UPI0021CED46B|nr:MULTISPECIES: acetolactate synthase small subunit [unclassified Staphylococcus]UXR69100.1 acetolactate synthase small subunit [Staphylococcus sp. IVB6246]UXR71151.1 acetolactate synthase small subunit [Staphylococcus sp. IVB6240]UXR75741.1 acetolactate synthase small subunit [Staphylococcus sp. IVB6233]UXR79940.1 acetolactate synthase small subunit [Staphylococcus sp. IVB6218]
MRRTFQLTVFDKAGTLNRLTSTFVRRQFNIVNITAGPTLETGITEITFVAEVPDDRVLRTIIQQLKKQVNTLTVEDITETNTFNLELLLIKLNKPQKNNQFSQLLHDYEAHVTTLKDDDETLYLQAVGPQDVLDQLLENLSAFDIQQLSRTGTAAIV